MKILIFGITGMLGSTIFQFFSGLPNFITFGTKRTGNSSARIIAGVDAKNWSSVEKAYNHVRPDFVINCIGAIKQLSEGNNPLDAIPLNSLFPHYLADLCNHNNSRLIHISTDCVFSGKKGNYTENDVPDAEDMYGRSKMLGEVNYSPALTLRTSIIGHELNSSKSLVCWFLSQKDQVKGFTQAIYSGLPTIELATIIEKIITKKPNLTGLYHVAAQPISKYELLCIIRDTYQKEINILPSDELVTDKSLNYTLFNQIMDYTPTKLEIPYQKNVRLRTIAEERNKCLLIRQL